MVALHTALLVGRRRSFPNGRPNNYLDQIITARSNEAYLLSAIHSIAGNEWRPDSAQYNPIFCARFKAHVSAA
jgi:hypothetical protein